MQLTFTPEMKSILAFLILLSHLNFTMFIPGLPETDIVSGQGWPEDDINTLYEYFDQVVFGYHDDTPEDEDDDQGQNFQLSQIDQYPFSRPPFSIKNPPSVMQAKNRYSSYVSNALPAVYYEIPSPPPEA